MKLRYALCAGAALSGLAAFPAFAQDNADQTTTEGEEIIVTAVARGQNRIESSVSVSTIGADTIANLAAPSAADLIRQIPGIRSEASVVTTRRQSSLSSIFEAVTGAAPESPLLDKYSKVSMR